MYKKHIQRQNFHLLDNKAVVPLTPVTSPSVRNRKVKPGKVFTDRADTPTIGNNSALKLLEKERIRLLEVSLTAEETKKKLQQELQKALSKRDQKGSSTSRSTKRHSSPKKSSTKRHSSPKKSSTKRHSNLPSKPLPRSSETVSIAPPSPTVVQEKEDSVTNEDLPIDLTQNFQSVIDTDNVASYSDNNEKQDSPVSTTRKRKYNKFQSDSNNNSCSEEDSIQNRIKVFNPFYVETFSG